MHNWLVGIDNSIWSYYAFNYAVSSISKEDLATHRLILLTVADKATSWVSEAVTSAQDLEEMEFKKEIESKRLLVFYGHRAKEAGIKVVLLRAIDKFPHNKICAAVQRYNVFQIFIGTRGLSTVKKLLLGSTSKSATENAECNVVIVKKPFGPPINEPTLQSMIEGSDPNLLLETCTTRISEDHPFREFDFLKKGERIHVTEDYKEKRPERERPDREKFCCEGEKFGKMEHRMDVGEHEETCRQTHGKDQPCRVEKHEEFCRQTHGKDQPCHVEKKIRRTRSRGKT